MGVQINGDTGNISATKADYSGNVTIGGTLTYEDVTNIDSVGLITAREGIEVGARPGVAASISVDGNAIFSGITTISTKIHVGVDTGVYGEDLVVTGNSRVTGITTFGDSDNSALMLNIDATSGLPTISIPDSIIHSGDTNTKIRFPAADTVSVETGGTQRFRVDSDGNVSIGDEPTVASDTLFHVEKAGETNVVFEGDTSTLGARLTLKNNNTGASAVNQIDFADAGGQSTSSIKGYNTDQDNNYGYLTFHTRSASGTPPEERMRISKEGYVTKPTNFCISYTASASTDYTSGTIIYNTEVFDIGNSDAYNTSTGVFTAPVDGMYSIYHEYYAVLNNKAMTEIQKSTNGGSSFSAIKYGPRVQGTSGDYSAISCTFLTPLNANDQIKIIRREGTIHINNTYTHFQVQLVQ